MLPCHFTPPISAGGGFRPAPIINQPGPLPIRLSMAKSAPAPGPGDPGALLVTDRMASLGALVTGVAHEINNPITYVLVNLEELGTLATAMREAILSYRARVSELMGDEAAETIAQIEGKVHRAGGLEVLDEIHIDACEGAGRIRDIVRDLLDVSRGSEEIAPLDIHEVLDSSLRLVSRTLATRARLEWDYGATIRPARLQIRFRSRRHRSSQTRAWLPDSWP